MVGISGLVFNYVSLAELGREKFLNFTLIFVKSRVLFVGLLYSYINAEKRDFLMKCAQPTSEKYNSPFRSLLRLGYPFVI